SNNKDKKEMKPGTKDRIPVELISTVDGDTAKFNYDGRTESFRFLLIDTPETKHPRVGKQPFGQEASDRTAELLTNAEKIEVEFDVGQKEDKYNRKLAYIYVDEEMLNNILVREGLAKVAYAYPPNTRYLDTLETSQEQAKSEKIGIWSIDSVFEKKQKDVYDSNENEDITTENQVDNPSSDVGQSEDSEQSTSNTESFPNCTALREVHPNGVPAGHAAYASKLDRDNDNYACEIN
ncbi:thermonuclease family protein, partial [Staphylococcus chromogenes]